MNQPQVGNEGRNDAAARAAAPQQKGGEAGTAVLGPFSLRELVVFGALLVILVASLVPFGIRRGELFGANIWNTGSVFFLGIGVLVPLAVGALFAARRLSPGTRLRVGSLSLDQFASVSAVLCLIYFLVQFSVFLSASLFICLLGALVFFAATTLAPHIPGFSADFAGRAEVPASRVARDAAPLARKPKAPAAAGQPGQPGQPGAPVAPGGVGHPDPRMSGRTGAPAAGIQGVPAGRGSADGAAAAAGAGAAAAAGAGVGAAEAGQAIHPSGPQSPQQAGASAPAANTAPAAPEPAAQDTSDRSGSAPADADRAGSAPADPRRSEAGAPAGAGHPEVSGGDVADGRTEGAATVQAGREEPLPATTANPVVENAAAHPRTESISAVRDENEPVVEAFWFAVGTPRQIVDERTGLPLFMFYPGDWELGLEDRGHEFLVQDKRTGRIGVLRDLSNIERVSSDDN